jgi:hypothetical protein
MASNSSVAGVSAKIPQKPRGTAVAEAGAVSAEQAATVSAPAAYRRIDFQLILRLDYSTSGLRFGT